MRHTWFLMLTLLLASCAAGRLFGPTFTLPPTSTPTPIPTSTFTPTPVKYPIDRDKLFNNMPPSYEALLASVQAKEGKYVKAPDPLPRSTAFMNWWENQLLPVLGDEANLPRNVVLPFDTRLNVFNDLAFGGDKLTEEPLLSQPEFFYFQDKGKIYPVLVLSTISYLPETKDMNTKGTIMVILTEDAPYEMGWGALKNLTEGKDVFSVLMYSRPDAKSMPDDCRVFMSAGLDGSVYQEPGPTPEKDNRAGNQWLIPACGRVQTSILTTVSPANPNATTDAIKVLNYLYNLGNLPDDTPNKVILGQDTARPHGLTNSADNHFGYQAEIVGLYNRTGKWPALMGSNYGDGEKSSAYTEINRTIVDYWNQGGLIEVDYWPYNPWTGGNFNDMNKNSTDLLTSADLTDLVTPGTNVNKVWLAQLDVIAGHLQELQNSGVIVIWRPFCEMNGGWFWWSAGNSTNNYRPFISLWQQMFNYFTYTKGLNNLLWEYAPTAINQSGENIIDKLYPGSNYVDLVGIDSYQDGEIMAGDQTSYEAILNFGKPIGYAEAGPRTRDGTFDDMNVINSIRDHYPKMSYFMEYNSWPKTGGGINHVALVDNQNARELVNDPIVITRNELDWKSIVISIPAPTITPAFPSTSTATPARRLHLSMM